MFTFTTLQKRLERWGFSWAGLRDNRHGEGWVVAQMVLIAAHALPPGSTAILRCPRVRAMP